jgi:hypothetical protein
MIEIQDTQFLAKPDATDVQKLDTALAKKNQIFFKYVHHAIENILTSSVMNII